MSSANFYSSFHAYNMLENFSTLCLVRADLSPLSASAEPKIGIGGKRYWTIVFSVEIHFGLTEFKARIKWVDNVSDFFCTFQILKLYSFRESQNSEFTLCFIFLHYNLIAVDRPQ